MKILILAWYRLIADNPRHFRLFIYFILMYFTRYNSVDDIIRSVQIEITECTCMRDIFQYFAFKA